MTGNPPRRASRLCAPTHLTASVRFRFRRPCADPLPRIIQIHHPHVRSSPPTVPRVHCAMFLQPAKRTHSPPALDSALHRPCKRPKTFHAHDHSLPRSSSSSRRPIALAASARLPNPSPRPLTSRASNGPAPDAAALDQQVSTECPHRRSPIRAPSLAFFSPYTIRSFTSAPRALCPAAYYSL